MATHAAILAIIHALARRQYGVVTRAQLLAAGLTPRVIQLRIADGTLRQLHRGVYHVGVAPLPGGAELGACLACGPASAVGFASGVRLWTVGNLPEPRIEVVSWGGDRRPRALRVHRLRTLHPDEHTVLNGIPVTTAARTILDVSGAAPLRAAERVLAEALVQRKVTTEELLKLCARHEHRRGAKILRTFLQTPPAVTRSEAEERMLALIRRGQIPHPEVNAVLHGYEVDFLWRQQRLIVEVDGVRYHGAKFEKDRRRDGVLLAARYRVMRVTWRQLEAEPEALLVRLGQALVSS